MKVDRLIERLKSFPPDLEVKISVNPTNERQRMRTIGRHLFYIVTGAVFIVLMGGFWYGVVQVVELSLIFYQEYRIETNIAIAALVFFVGSWFFGWLIFKPWQKP